MSKGEEVPEQLRAHTGFHGTSRDISDTIIPANQHGLGTIWAHSGKSDTYFIPKMDEYQMHDQDGYWDNVSDMHIDAENKAWGWAERSAEQARSDPSPRPRVYLTSPHPDQHFDNNYNPTPRRYETLTSSRVAPSQSIKDTIWGPPPPPGGHTEMTLPHINWQQFGGANYIVHDTQKGVAIDDRGVKLPLPSVASEENMNNGPHLKTSHPVVQPALLDKDKKSERYRTSEAVSGGPGLGVQPGWESLGVLHLPDGYD